MAAQSYAFDYLNAPEIVLEPKAKKRRKPNIDLHLVEETDNKSLSKANLFKSVLYMLLIGFVVICFIYLSATKSNIKYSINKIEAENKALTNKVVILQSDIASSNSLDSIKIAATDELGMIYANASQCVYINETNVNSGLVDLIKEKAYS